MKTAKDIMTENPITVAPDTEVSKVTEILLQNRINGVPVVNESGELVGIVCQSDLISQQKKLPIPSFFTILDGFFQLTSMKQIEKAVQKVAASTVADIMTAKPTSISPDTSVETIATMMVEKNYHTLPVVSEGKLCGVVGKEDILKMLMT